MGAPWAAVAQAAGEIAGQGMGMVNANQQRQFDKGQAREADARALANSKEMALFNNKLQKDMWEYTGYVGQVDQMKRAGINPALMYGGAGSGGSTNVSTQTMQGTAAKAQMPDGRGMGMAIGDAILKAAQVDNIKADTEKKQVEAEKLAGVDTEESRARTADLTQGVENKKAQEYLTKAQGYMQDMQNFEQGASQKDRLEQIGWATERAENEVRQMRNETYVSNATVQDKIKQIRAQATGAVIENRAKETGIKLTETQIDALKAKVMQDWESLKQGENKIAIDKFKAELDAMYPGISDTIGGALNAIMEDLREVLGEEDGERGRKIQLK